MLTIGYSAASVNFSLSNIKAVVRTDENIRVTNISVASVTSDAESTYEEYNVSSIVSDVHLPNSDSTVTYNIEVTNLGNVEMGIKSISGLPSDLNYTLIGYTMEATLCDSVNNLKCKLGSVTRFQILIEYANGAYDGINTEYNLNLEFEFYEINYVARIGGVYYTSLQNAADAVPTDHTETTIVLLKNSTERVTVNPGKNIILNLQGLVLTNPGNVPIIEIKGTKSGVNITGSTVRMSNGTLYTDATQAGVNVEAKGEFIMTGGRIIANGSRQALYVDANGTAIISGSAYLKAQAEVETSQNGRKRGTVHVLANGNLTVTGGTIEAVGIRGIAVSNAGTTTIGIEDGSVDITTPLMTGVDYGVYLVNGGTFNFYDGVAKGKIAAFNNEAMINDKEDDYGILHDTQIINGDTYHTASLTVGEEATVTFDANGGTVSETTRNVIVGTAVGGLPVPTWTNYTFIGWFTQDGREIQASEEIMDDVTYYAHWVSDSYYAMIGDVYYTSLQAAVTAATNSPTTITLIRDTSEQVVVNSGKNIILDMKNKTISNNGTKSVLEILGGSVTMTNGTITSRTTQGAVNVKSGGTFNISGGSIVATGTRQAIYIENGSVMISGTAYLSAKAEVVDNNKRGTVHVLANGNLTVTGGTIEAIGTNGIAISNAGISTIGNPGGGIVTTSPVIKGLNIGFYNTRTLNFYDGILKGITAGLSGNITNREQNSTIITASEVIDGEMYETIYLN